MAFQEVSGMRVSDPSGRSSVTYVLAGPITAELDVGVLHACNVRRDLAAS